MLKSEYETRVKELESAGKWNEVIALKLGAQKEGITDTEQEPGEPDQKALFLPDFNRLTQELEQEMADAGTDARKKLDIMNRLTALKYNWQVNGVANIGVVVAVRDSIAHNLETAGRMSLSDDSIKAIFGTSQERLEKLNEIIAQAKARGLEGIQ